MTGAEVLDLGRDALWATVAMSSPAMVAGLVIGLAIALFQAYAVTASIWRQNPAIRAKIPSENSASVAPIRGRKTSNAPKMTRIFGTNTRVIS